MPYEKGRDILHVQLASLPRSDASIDKATVLLSLDYFLLKPAEVSLEEAFTWVDIAHSHIEEAFEACLTGKLRHSFKEVKE